MLTSLVSLQQGNVKKCQKVFRKDVAYENIKSIEKTRFHSLSLSRKHIFGKSTGWGQIDSLSLSRIEEYLKSCKLIICFVKSHTSQDIGAIDIGARYWSIFFHILSIFRNVCNSMKFRRLKTLVSV